jgi:hypothetical protein
MVVSAPSTGVVVVENVEMEIGWEVRLNHPVSG